MKLVDLIQFGNQIIEDKEQLFIATEDFFFKGLPILKNSLVYYDGIILRVNILPTTLLAPQFIDLYKLKGQIPEDDEGFLIIDRESDCAFEETQIQTGIIGYWHKDHLDNVGVFSKYYNARLRNNEPEINFKDVVLSSIFYELRIHDEELLQFINTQPLKISLNNAIITLPKDIEVHKNNESYTLVPIEGIEYKGVYFDAGEGLTLNSDGVLEGYTGKGFRAEATNLTNNSSTIIELPSHIYIYISPAGLLTTRLFDSEAQDRISYQLRKL